MAAEAGRGDEFVKLNNWVLEGLSKAIDQRIKAENSEVAQSHPMPGAVFFTLFDDRHLGYHDWTAKFMLLRDRIAAGEGYNRRR